MALETYKLEQYIKNDRYVNFNMESISSDNLGVLSEPRRNSFYQIMILERGSATYFVDFEKYEIVAPAVCFIFPQQIFKYELNQDASGDIIMFDETIFCSEILSTELKEYNVDLHKRINYVDFREERLRFDEILMIKSQIESLWKSLNNIRKVEIKFMIKIIIFKIIDTSSGDITVIEKSRDLEIYIEFRELVDKEFETNRKVDSYCQKLNISAKKLNLICNEFTDKTALEVIHDRLSNEIKKIFIFEDLTLKEIAFRLGFDSQPALNKYIASKFGCTPSELKDKVQTSY